MSSFEDLQNHESVKAYEITQKLDHLVGQAEAKKVLFDMVLFQQEMDKAWPKLWEDFLKMDQVDRLKWIEQISNPSYAVTKDVLFIGETQKENRISFQEYADWNENSDLTAKQRRKGRQYMRIMIVKKMQEELTKAVNGSALTSNEGSALNIAAMAGWKNPEATPQEMLLATAHLQEVQEIVHDRSERQSLAEEMSHSGKKGPLETVRTDLGGGEYEYVRIVVGLDFLEYPGDSPLLGGISVRNAVRIHVNGETYDVSLMGKGCGCEGNLCISKLKKENPQVPPSETDSELSPPPPLTEVRTETPPAIEEKTELDLPPREAQHESSPTPSEVSSPKPVKKPESSSPGEPEEKDEGWIPDEWERQAEKWWNDWNEETSGTEEEKTTSSAKKAPENKEEVAETEPLTGTETLSEADFDKYFHGEIEQGLSGNCYALTALKLLSQNPLFEPMVRNGVERKNGVWKVKMPLIPDGTPTQVIEVREEELIGPYGLSPIGTADASIGFLVLEAAYIIQKFGKLDRRAASGGVTGKVLQAFGGASFENYISDPDTLLRDYIDGEFMISVGLQDEFSSGPLLGTWADHIGDYTSEHAYGVLRVDKSTEKITLFNPWNTGNPFTISFQEFKENFDYVQGVRINKEKLPQGTR